MKSRGFTIYFRNDYNINNISIINMISIEKAQELVDREIANDALRKHMLAVSAIMAALADRMGIGEQENCKR